MERRRFDRNGRDRRRDYDHFHHRDYRDHRDLDFDEFLRLLLLRQLLDGSDHDGDRRERY